MPTIRSALKVEQFERVLQRLAHDLPKFRRVRTENLTIDFIYDDTGNPKRVRVSLNHDTGRMRRDSYGGDRCYEWPEIEYLSFTVEPKLYLSSPHVTKVTVGDDDDREFFKRIEELLLHENEKPLPRFTLSQSTGGQRYLDLPK